MNKNIGYIICESSMGPAETKITPKTINGKVVADVVLQTANEKNRNGRFYAKEELFPQLTAPRTIELLESGTLRAECGHPLSKDLQRQSTIDDTKTCARFLKLWTEGFDVRAHVVGTNNMLGHAFDLDLKEGCKPAWSLRALGSVETTPRGAEVRNLRLITWDNVIYPSHPGAYTIGLVAESTEVEQPKTHLQDIVDKGGILESGDLLADDNDIFEEHSGIVTFNNEAVIKFIQQESANLKFLQECLDFAYQGIALNEAGTKVILNTDAGDTMVINLESYIHNELMRYATEAESVRAIHSMKESKTPSNYSILRDMKK